MIVINDTSATSANFGISHKSVESYLQKNPKLFLQMPFILPTSNASYKCDILNNKIVIELKKSY